jgi:uncharacterized membrane protein YfcA
MITDINFYLVAIPAVLVYGIAKGGFGGALGVIAVPLMCLVVSPKTAASVLLPILCVMDQFAVYEHRKNINKQELLFMLPMAIVGITVAGVFMGNVNDYYISLFIGSLSIAFSLNYFFVKSKVKLSPTAGRFMCFVSGIASTTIHSGGAPISMYLYPKGLPVKQMMGTLALFFCILNLIKLIPYTLLGGFSAQNLTTSLVLIPLAPIGVKIGVWMLDKIKQSTMYNLCYALLLVSGVKLVFF